MGKDTFKKDINKIGLALSDVQIEQLDKYYEILVEWNEFMNLTGITEYDEVLQKHFIDSLVLYTPLLTYTDTKARAELKCTVTVDSEENVIRNLKEIFEKPKIKLIDVGTGAGFPGLPIKIGYPKIDVVLLDSLNKRIKFLDEVIRQVGLKQIKAVHGRAEEAARNKEYREQFDISVSRAVANLASLVEYNLPFVKVGGYFIAYKSGTVDNEVREAKKSVALLGGNVDMIYKFTLPDSNIERSLVFIRKTKNTSKKYPRKAGLPTKEPII